MQGENQKPLAGELLGEDAEMSLEQLCRAFELSRDEIIELVDEGVLEPLGAEPAEWRFQAVCLRRIRITRNLRQELGLNAPGAALALELLEEIEELRRRLRRFEG